MARNSSEVPVHVRLAPLAVMLATRKPLGAMSGRTGVAIVISDAFVENVVYGLNDARPQTRIAYVVDCVRPASVSLVEKTSLRIAPAVSVGPVAYVVPCFAI